jgi:hypothetical protein
VEVAEGQLSYRASAVLARLSHVKRITHEGSRVTVVRARLLPPGFDTAVLIVGHDRFVRVLAWYGRDRALLRALTAAGFDLDEHRTWLSLGWRIAKTSLRRKANRPRSRERTGELGEDREVGM